MRRPLHLWIVGILALLWAGGGALDYVMTQIRNPTYLRNASPAQRQILEALPLWEQAVWALGVWGTVAGALLLLLRSRAAVPALALGLAGLAGNALHGFVFATPSSYDLAGAVAVWLTAIQLAIVLALLVYARAMTRRGVLR